MAKAVVPLSAYFTILKGEATSIDFIDSTSIKVCHNLRIPHHRSPNGFILNLLAGLVAYCLKDNKPTFNITDVERKSMVID